MMWQGALAVGSGAAFGAWMRWALGSWLNPVIPTLPLGTLAANLAGGYLIGIAVAYFGEHAGLPAEVRLFIITGFLGGLTTFSTFSAETVTLLTRAQYAWAFALISAHLAGSIAMTVLGILTIKWLRGA
jgi:CrcB protein